MDLENLSEPKLITRPADLQRMADRLLKETIVAVDTESNSLFAYYEQVCLIQFSTVETDYLVDPLSLDDLTPLEPIFSSPQIEKVFHAAEYDLICLKRDFGFRFENLFDTMVAASILGLELVGLGSLLESEFGVHLDKRFQRANWGQRPLPSNLLNYARLDTHFLLPLRDRMKQALEAAGRWPLAAEDFKRLTLIGDLTPESAHKVVRSAEDLCWRISGINDLQPQQIAVLQELCRYRDQVARTLNRPLFKVISDSTLLAIATALPRTIEELKQIPGMTTGQVQRHGSALLQLVQKGKKEAPVYPPRQRRPDEQYLQRIENLRQWRKETARQMGVKSDVILARDLMIAIAEQNPSDMMDLAEILGEVPWRLEKFGSQIFNVIQNHRS